MEIFLDSIKNSIYKFSRNKVSIIGFFMVAMVIIVAIFAPLLAPYPKAAGAFIDFSNASKPPSRAHFFGTDVVGRDILSRVMFAFRGALIMGLGVIAAIVPFGVLVGLFAGYYYGTWIDTVVMRITDIFVTLPALLLALAVASFGRPSLFNSMMAVAFAWWPFYARLTYSMASSVRNETFVKAAQTIGAHKAHIIFKEILPNCLAPIFTKMALEIGWVILVGATLSFVGLGEQPPTAALGTMVSDGAQYLPAQWWISLFPALAICFMILAFNLLGDGVKSMLSTEVL
ncbi:ABC transporter permease [Candidatus Cryosericum septentrionale]|jgi:peptide/nickel transport system permease protein|uniref:ABC transporter permease n=1 Tax=Candidatus Cryosericum septentrionale TaxID=2290913 RepID=A0A398DMJ0_9BACT|nr:ABC transporter permease [Candidatus Cryosericum septentrionale]RIE16886.1 ABC transporter permease [Candidatus Cryosericum septentrionale]